jgi:hypothetical protein
MVMNGKTSFTTWSKRVIAFALVVFAFMRATPHFEWLRFDSATAEPASAPMPPIEAAFISLSPSTKVPSVLLSSGQATTSSGVHFAKLSVVLKEEHVISRVSIESCAGEMSDGVEVHFAPGFRSVFVEGGHTVLEANVIESALPVRSFALVFRLNDGLCLKNLHIYDVKGEPYVWKNLSETNWRPLNDKRSVERVFDGSLETNADLGGDGATLISETAVTVDRMYVWIPDSEGQALRLAVEGDNGAR